ncbi:hypothetical protein FE257_002269 [Aspergillus nanangensis]|uniref:Methyltransferase domain-containing protein n=1 Tax=Aspergillus nanangensis TaxID=2582783 RepID=A0AAD4CE27_ASPNN|nr:hypothetical protein FE257_002269 [Aspergillus nanangensis]
MTQTIQEFLAINAASDPGQQPIHYIETVEAYNQWAKVYDTDGNFLQALDTIEMQCLLPLFLDKVTKNPPSPQPRVIDLGCGTGRNTLELVRRAPPDACIVGLDASPGMLDIAREAIHKELGVESSRATLEIFDLLRSPLALPVCSQGAVGIISTLVLEHIPLDQFFGAAAAMLSPGGYFLVTNMHSDMGSISQAGFVDAETGAKIRPTSYSHTVSDTLAAAQRAGFDLEELDGECIRERKMDDTMVEILGHRAKKWVGIRVWFSLCFRKQT